MIAVFLLSATVLLGGCSPPLPKTWLSPAGDRMYDGPVSSKAKHAIMASQVTILH
jgi:hypothetical protein